MGGSSTGEYQKSTLEPNPNEGTVYVVAGSSGQSSHHRSLNHPATFISLNVLGSLVLDVTGSRLDAMFLDSTGVIRDYFSIVKNGAEGFADTDHLESRCDSNRGRAYHGLFFANAYGQHGGGLGCELHDRRHGDQR